MIEEDIRRWQGGDRLAFKQLYDNYGAALHGVAYKIVQDDTLAQDILQDAFVKIWKNRKSYDIGKAKLFTWMMRITRNTALDLLRKKDMKYEIQTNEQYVYDENRSLDGDQVVIDGDMRDQVAKLKPEHERVINAVYFLGHTHKEAAEKLNLPLGTVKTRVRLALQELKKTFAINP